MEITIDELKKVGFKDVSHDQNGAAYRLYLPGGMFELCLYINDPHIRLQTISSGFTMSLKGIQTINGLSEFVFMMYGISWHHPKFKN